VRYRLLVLEYAWQHGPAAAGRHYGLSARTIRRWRKRWRQGGGGGLVPSYPRHRARRVPPAAIELIRQARQEFGCGAARTRLWLQRVHGIRLAMGTIQRVFRDMRLPRLRRTRKREPRQIGRLGVSCRRMPDTQTRGSIYTRPNTTCSIATETAVSGELSTAILSWSLKGRQVGTRLDA